MKIAKRINYILGVIVLISSVLLLNGCGSTKESKSEGCPSGSNLANSDDIITSTGICGWEGYVYAGSWLSINGEGCTQDPVFTVTDSSGTPRNNVCIVFTTNSTWWADHSYTTKLNTDQIVRTTNNNGTVTLYWTTYPLPLSSAATSTSAAGQDNTYVQAAISAVSGAVSHEDVAAINVKGCQTTSFGPPATCP